MADALLPRFCHGWELPCSVVEDRVREGSAGVVESFLRGVEGVPMRGTHCFNNKDLARIMV